MRAIRIVANDFCCTATKFAAATLVATGLLCVAAPPHAAAAVPQDGPADRAVVLDPDGVVRWRDSGEEVRLFGANYCLMSGSDFRMAGLVGGDRKAMIDEDLAHFARMGWTALRLCSWGDWENSDRDGNLIANEHLDLLDYLIARARARGIYLLLTPIHTYDPAFADQMGKPTTNVGFSRYFPRDRMGTDPAAIAAQVNYIRQLLQHLNPYTGVALKDEAAVLFVEPINEPVHHPEDPAAAVRYIDSLVAAVRGTGCTKLTFFNVTQDIRIAGAIHDSKVDGVSFGWYPSGLVAGHTLQGNFLPAVDAYPEMLRSELRGRPRIVYEFDQADLLTATLYPAMVRTFRSVGAQLATMFAYDMLQTAQYNLGWQTHFLNLVHTPRKAVSAAIAAEAMRRLPAYQSYGAYPENTSFGDFRVSYDGDLSELNAPDAFMSAGPSATRPRDPAALRQIIGFGSSALVQYEGTGAYFLDKVRGGLWRLELYPDQVMVRDPFEQPRPDKTVSRLLYRIWPMTVRLPDLGERFFAIPIRVPGEPSPQTEPANEARFLVQPGVWLLSHDGQVDRASLPPRIARVGFDEYHVNPRVSNPDQILSLTPSEFVAGEPASVRVTVANDVLPDAVRLWMRPAGSRRFGEAVPMRRATGNEYTAELPAAGLGPGLYEYVVSAATGARTITFPGGSAQEPGQWPFQAEAPWSFRVTPAGTPLRLFDPKKDFKRLGFVRVSEKVRSDFFRIGPGDRADESALELRMPGLGADTPPRYAAEIYVGDLMGARSADVARARAVEIRLRALRGTRRTVELDLIERDGTAWSTTVAAPPDWSSVEIPWSDLRVTRSILIPSPYPQQWDYWRASPRSRGGAGDRINVAALERLQFVVFPGSVGERVDDAPGVALQAVYLDFAPAH